MPHLTGVQLIESLREAGGDFEAIVVSAYTDSEDLIAAVNSDLICRYIVKPFEPAELQSVVAAATERLTLRRNKKQLEAELLETNAKLLEENRALKTSLSDPLDGFLGFHWSIERLKELVRAYATTEEPILIEGETGTGKELLARAIHALSSRSNAAFVPINCSAIPSHLFESELFGYEKGAFTDAREAKPGILSVADGGTLFLDEIGDMPMELQPKVLRVLQFGTYYPIGGRAEKNVNVRLLTATNRRLKEEVAADRFREDLYYRINTLHVVVPPVRERREDILPMIDALAARRGIALPTLSQDARRLVRRYDFPGNVREIENFIAKLYACSASRSMNEFTAAQTAEILGFDGDSGCTDTDTLPDGRSAIDLHHYLEEIERAVVSKFFAETNRNLSETARLLGLTRHGLRNKLRRYELYDEPSETPWTA
jgi:DNA-binding NtrC family response regulator